MTSRCWMTARPRRSTRQRSSRRSTRRRRPRTPRSGSLRRPLACDQGGPERSSGCHDLPGAVTDWAVRSAGDEGGKDCPRPGRQVKELGRRSASAEVVRKEAGSGPLGTSEPERCIKGIGIRKSSGLCDAQKFLVQSLYIFVTVSEDSVRGLVAGGTPRRRRGGVTWMVPPLRTYVQRRLF